MCIGIEFGVEHSGSGAEDHYLSGSGDPAVSQAIAVFELAVQWKEDEFHVIPGLVIKTGTRSKEYFIPDPEVAKSHLLRVEPVSIAEPAPDPVPGSLRFPGPRPGPEVNHFRL